MKRLFDGSCFDHWQVSGLLILCVEWSVVVTSGMTVTAQYLKLRNSHIWPLQHRQKQALLLVWKVVQYHNPRPPNIGYKNMSRIYLKFPQINKWLFFFWLEYLLLNFFSSNLQNYYMNKICDAELRNVIFEKKRNNCGIHLKHSGWILCSAQFLFLISISVWNNSFCCVCVCDPVQPCEYLLTCQTILEQIKCCKMFAERKQSYCRLWHSLGLLY